MILPLANQGMISAGFRLLLCKCTPAVRWSRLDRNEIEIERELGVAKSGANVMIAIFGNFLPILRRKKCQSFLKKQCYKILSS
jgi:hypothetical protein